MISARNSSCPDPSRWLQKVSRSWVTQNETRFGCKLGKKFLKGGCQPKEPIVFFNVGANKGFAVSTILQQFTQNSGVTNAAWLQEMLTFLVHQYSVKNATQLANFLPEYCGACGACHETPRLMPHVTTSVELDIHAFEIAQLNVRWLKWAFDPFPAERTH